MSALMDASTRFVSEVLPWLGWMARQRSAIEPEVHATPRRLPLRIPRQFQRSSPLLAVNPLPTCKMKSPISAIAAWASGKTGTNS